VTRAIPPAGDHPDDRILAGASGVEDGPEPGAAEPMHAIAD